IIIPFENLRPEWKVIRLDGRSPLTHDCSVDGYPLALPMTVTGDPAAVEAFLARWTGPSTNRHPAQLTRAALPRAEAHDGATAAVEAFLARWTGPSTNRDPAKLTRVAMTGVTALVRATAAQMERNGLLWPGEEVAPVLQSADIAHVSNEVSFAADCPPPDPY